MEGIATKSKNIRLSPAEKKRLERLCNTRTNWTDGGYWNGMGKEPSCHVKETFASIQTHSVTFPTDEGAFKWNNAFEEAIKLNGHVATVALTVTVGLATGGTAAIVVGALAAILKDEIQAMVTYPKVARGWKHVMKITRTSQWSPHPYGKNGFTIEMHARTYDHTGQLQLNAKKILKYSYEELPQELANSIAQLRTRTTSSVYR